MDQGKPCKSLQYHEPSNAQRNHTASTDNYGLMQWSAINVWTHGAQSNWGILERNTETLSPLRKLRKEALHLLKLLACLHLRFHIDPACFYCLSRSWDRTCEPGSLHVSCLLVPKWTTFSFITWEKCSLTTKDYWSNIGKAMCRCLAICLGL